MAKAVTMRVNYCASLPAFLKWLEIIIACIVLGLILWEAVDSGHYSNRSIIHGEEYTVFVACFVIILNLIFLFTICMSLYSGVFGGMDCLSIITVYYFLCVIMWFIAGGVEVYATLQYRDCRAEAGCENRYGRRAAAAALSFLNGILFISSLQHVRMYTSVVFVTV